MKTEKILSGIAGEYFVAGELSRRGIIAGLTLRNNADIDIVASNAEGTKTANVQVKTRRTDKGGGWIMGGNPLLTDKKSNKIFYVLVEISSDKNDGGVAYYVVPKNLLNKKVEQAFQKWRAGKKKSGEPRKSETRVLLFKEVPGIKKYRDRWDLLKLE